ncbi:hypothetical protein ACHAXM_008680 [Skeletonema potamos]|jgi:acetoin utilization deacetylase AcuC-like enzyme/ankyrin repeat protein
MTSHPPEDENSDEEWDEQYDEENVGSGGSRYPVHDACEFEDAESLRRLIFVPQSDESSVSDDSTTSSNGTSSGDEKEDQHHDNVAAHAAAVGHSPLGVTNPEQAAMLIEQAKNGETVIPPPHGDGATGEDGKFTKPLGGPDDKNGVDDAMEVDKVEEGEERNIDAAAMGQQVSPETPATKNGNGEKQTKKRAKLKYSCPYDLDERDDDENTPLHIAIHARKIDNVRVLLEAGASLHKKCDGSAPIHLAISLGAIAAHVEFAKQCVELLQSVGADMTMRDDSVHTPLYLACVSTLVPVLEILLNDPKSRATLNLKADRTGGRALHAAAKCDVARKGNPRPAGERGVTEMLLGTPEIEIDAQNNYGRTPLHIAAARGNWHVARLLINAGADVHAIDKRGFTPGQVARKRGMVVPNDLKILSEDSPARDLIIDPDGSTLILCHELCLQHRTCPPIVRGVEESSEPPPENIRRLSVLINDDDGILRCGEFSGCKWNTDVRRAALSDVLKVHEYTYVEKTSKLCSATPDHPKAIQTLDADTTVSHWSFEAALRAAGSVCEAVDKVMAGDHRNAFCAIRPPGHHAGPRGIVTCPNDPDGSHGFCLLNNIAIGAAYARSMYRNDGIKKVAIIDFDVHHGNGTEEIVRQLTPNIEHAVVRTPFAVGAFHTSSYKPWLDENDINDVFFASTHGYGPRDRQLHPGMVQGGWFYPASGATFKSKSLISPSDVETPTLSEFLLSQSWARLGDEYRNNCCKIIDIGLSLPYKDDAYHHSLQRCELRDAYRKNVLPSLLEFDPDMIFVSAGFDAHRKDTMNFGYVGMLEEDYEWITEQLVKVANTCCNGRIVSALEGGYKIHGGIISPFARSVASHVRALVDGGSSRELYDKDEVEWESQYEKHMIEEKEKKRQMKQARASSAARELRQSFLLSTQQKKVVTVGEQSHEDALLREELPQNDVGIVDEPTRKRARKPVDYKQLLEEMQTNSSSK